MTLVDLKTAMFGFVILGAIGVAQAVTPVSSALEFKNIPGGNFQTADWTKLNHQIPKDQRFPASAEYEELASKVIAAKNATDVQALIEKTAQQLPQMKDPSAKFLAEHLQMLEGARGILWRVRPVFEKRMDQNRLAQSAAVSLVKQSVAGIAIMNPSPNAVAVLDYISAPYSVDGQLAAQMHSEADVQAWLHKEIRPRVAVLIQKLQALSNEAPMMRWNLQISYGAKSFPDGIGREVVFGPEELQALIAGYELNVAQIDVFSAYNQEGVFAFQKQMGQLYGFDGFLLADVDGITGIEISKVMQDPRNKALWTLISKDDFGKKAMAEALAFNRSAAARLTEVWKRVKDRPANQTFSLPQTLVTMDSLKSDAYVDTLNRIVNGQPVRSSITGELAKVNFTEMFQNPPADLKAFYPTAFETRRTLDASVAVGGKPTKMSYRNFMHGSPTGWDLNAFKKYTDVKTQADVARTLRVLNHTAGGFSAR